VFQVESPEVEDFCRLDGWKRIIMWREVAEGRRMSQQHVSRAMRSISNRIAVSLASLAFHIGRRWCPGCAASLGIIIGWNHFLGTPRFLFFPLSVSPPLSALSLAVPSSFWNSDLCVCASTVDSFVRSIRAPGGNG
jgi:hypothetical protein